MDFDHEKNVMEIKKIDLKGSGERSPIWKDCSGRRVVLHKTLPASIPLSTSKETFPIDFRVFVVDRTSERRKTIVLNLFFGFAGRLKALHFLLASSFLPVPTKQKGQFTT